MCQRHNGIRGILWNSMCFRFLGCPTFFCPQFWYQRRHWVEAGVDGFRLDAWLILSAPKRITARLREDSRKVSPPPQSHPHCQHHHQHHHRHRDYKIQPPLLNCLLLLFSYAFSPRPFWGKGCWNVIVRKVSRVVPPLTTRLRRTTLWWSPTTCCIPLLKAVQRMWCPLAWVNWRMVFAMLPQEKHTQTTSFESESRRQHHQGDIEWKEHDMICFGSFL